MEQGNTITWKYLAGILAGGITFIVFLLLQQYPRFPWVVLTSALWFGAIVGMALLVKKKFPQQYQLLPLFIVLGLSFIGLFFVVELQVIRRLVLLLSTGTYALLFAWNIKDEGLWESMKPLRRFVMMCWVFAAYASMTTLFALSAFFQGKLVSIITIIIGALLYGYISINIWRLYFQSAMQSLILWALIVGVVFLEIIWVVGLLPFVYGVLGLLVTWIWYIFQLLTRFHFSTRGIEWKRQLPFLLINGMLFVGLLLFFVRWV